MFKVVLLGEGSIRELLSNRLGRVGKSSMIKQIMKGKFEEDEVTTTQASNCKKTVTVDNQVSSVFGSLTQTVTLDIWDTAGQERYHALGPVYYRDAGFVFLFL